MAGAVQNMLAVNNNLPVKTVKDLIALARKSPGKLVMASGGAGNTGHLGGELFKAMTGTYMLHVPYRGSPAAITDLIGGQADLIFDNLSSVGSHVKSGRVRGIGVSGLKRSPTFPDMPTIAESGLPGVDVSSWYAIMAPAKTPPETVAAVAEEVRRILALPDVRQTLDAQGLAPVGMRPADFAAHIRRETASWAKVIREANIKPE
jgi:tripartite-type tricarboxylate transporter receptor subunit TctC